MEISRLLHLIKCVWGPRLKRMFYEGRDQTGAAYMPNKLERYADCVIIAASCLVSIAYHVTPLYLTYYIIRYGFPSTTGAVSTLRGLIFIPLSVTLAFIIRGIGRYRNSSYNEFLLALDAARNLQASIGPLEARNTGISKYDFEMFAYPVTFRYDQSTVKPRKLSSQRKMTLTEKMRSFPLTAYRYLGARIVGRRMIYPGSNGIFNLLLDEPLSLGRAKLRRVYDGHRAKLLSCDGNCIDSMFIDRRGSPDSAARGNKLMICCEGNAAYYELGIMEVALQAGYSTLGWNHPGFGESTGLPFPDQEFNAIDVVIRYAVTILGFSFEDIVLFGWSIGGYTATCGAMSYPDISGLILDATFDELFPLVKKHAPEILERSAHGMVEQFFNLNIAEQACCYHGPISIIRRERDEMMAIQMDRKSNRANYLLIKVLQTRYPNLSTPEGLKALMQWLSIENKDQVMQQYGVNSRICRLSLSQYMSEKGEGYPWLIGDKLTVQERTRLLLYLASQYMLDHPSSHCEPLPVEMVQLPSRRGNLRN